MNVKQTGGSHYEKMAYQPIDFILDIAADFPTGCVIKYVSRYKDKNGNKDLRKALDNLTFMMIREDYRMRLNTCWPECLEKFVRLNGLSKCQANALQSMCVGSYHSSKIWISNLIMENYGNNNDTKK